MAITPMYRVTQIATGVAGSPYYLTGYFDTAGGTAQDAADAWRAFLGSGVGTYLTPMTFNSIVSVDEVDPVTGNLTGLNPVSVGQVTFTRAEDRLPPSNTLLVSWRTGVYIGGREVRGRTNLSGFGESDNAAGVPTSTLLTAVTSRITGLLGAANSEFVVYSRKAGQHYPVTFGSVGTQWAVLRSRRD